MHELKWDPISMKREAVLRAARLRRQREVECLKAKRAADAAKRANTKALQAAGKSAKCWMCDTVRPIGYVLGDGTPLCDPCAYQLHD
jgi:hypothetical protein